LIENIAYIVRRNYPEVVRTYVEMGFIPEDIADRVDLAEYYDVVGRVFEIAFSEASDEMKQISVQDLQAEMNTIGDSVPFSLPPFFALVLRAFSVLEGIALSVEPSWAMLDESYPYVAKRLLTDETSQKALTDFIMDKDGQLEIKQLTNLLDRYETFQKDLNGEGN
jgi:aarF domain-containing kinase